MKKPLFLLISLSLLFGCTIKKQAVVNKKIIIEKRKVARFSEINVQGDINLTIKRGKTFSLALKGDANAVRYVKTNSHQGILSIETTKYHQKYPHKISATVVTPVLNKLVYHGSGDIFAKNFSSSVLDISIETDGDVFLKGKMGARDLRLKGRGSISLNGVSSRNLAINMAGKPRVNLRGMANLRQLHAKGDGSLNFFWVDSPYLDIKAYDKSFISLAGKVGTLHAILHDKAQLDGRYLRINKSMVKTFDNSIARIQVIKSQSSVAMDDSNIYYYNHPAFKSTYMAHNGAVLDMTQNW